MICSLGFCFLLAKHILVKSSMRWNHCWKINKTVGRTAQCGLIGKMWFFQKECARYSTPKKLQTGVVMHACNPGVMRLRQEDIEAGRWCFYAKCSKTIRDQNQNKDQTKKNLRKETVYVLVWSLHSTVCIETHTVSTDPWERLVQEFYDNALRNSLGGPRYGVWVKLLVRWWLFVLSSCWWTLAPDGGFGV